jgi:hypothetical protein
MLPDGWQRIGADLKRTTGHTLELVWNDDDGLCEVAIDGTNSGGFGINLGDDETVIAEIADRLQEWGLDELIWGGWPTCPRHHTHPLEATVVDGRAVWTCPSDSITVALIGSLTKLG